MTIHLDDQLNLESTARSLLDQCPLRFPLHKTQDTRRFHASRNTHAHSQYVYWLQNKDNYVMALFKNETLR